MKVVIDLGHGGHDPGAVGKGGTKESDVVLKIGKYLESILRDVDIEVRFTRISDKYVSLGDRVKLANGYGADYFVSIHVNSCSDSSVRGVEVWQYSSDEKLEQFSSGICEEIAKVLKIRNRGIKYSKSLYVLKNTLMKAALIEVDFISNEKCEKDLNKDSNIKVIAESIKDNLLELCSISRNEGKLYRVCIGAYKNKSNAISAMNMAESKGFSDVYII